MHPDTMADPVKRPAVLVEVVVLAAGFLLFSRLHAVVATSRSVATANAQHLQSAENALHLNVELAANRWLVEHPLLIPPAVYCYRLYYVVLLGVLGWVYLRHPEVYRQARRTLLAMALLVLPIYWAVPMSPPRFALPGIVDIIAEHDLFGSTASRDIGAGQNFTAMPSMHVGWSAWCAYAVWAALRATHPRAAVLAWGFPLLMTAVVLTTGNHYVLDVAGTAALLTTAVGAAALTGRLVSRARR
ncbi:phosphatase PAP2 family protein [Paractinoplanes toevensis]|uniref:Inositol phosphorylceramide synthase n=1 Tax=Paractinoplanes toevensis TaxID=571911 RepID=A0A919TBT4_9ACTN|nr:phosphatase PAP2 family protein [Actinoplanes toevensis]GIM91876.1 inositol phosphorylceramide synthase [Actinoplanes toevensis]